MRMAAGAVHAAVGDRQYGVGRRGGPQLEVEEVRAAIRRDPKAGVGAVDVENAFGSIEWADVLRVTTAATPQVAPMMAAQWANREVVVRFQNVDGTWTKVRVYGGVFQGNYDGHPSVLPSCSIDI